MPQASQELRDKFPDMDGEAMEVLDANFIIDRHFLIHPKRGYTSFTERENDAIQYLIDEWDYGYDPEPADAELERDFDRYRELLTKGRNGGGLADNEREEFKALHKKLRG